MCGIAGLVNFDGTQADRALLKKMAASIVHRGPDGEGMWVDEGAGLVHRRLSIIDVEGGAQPMSSPDGRYTIVYNGELYNFRELKAKLSGEYHFGTSSDTEVVLAAFCRYGSACLQTFNGIFAFVVWDNAERSLFLARDNFGVKPLYYAVAGKTVYFGSEIKAILAAEPAFSRLSLKNLDTALAWRYSPSPQTLFEKIKKIRPGHFLVCKNGEIKTDRYLARPVTPAELSEVEALEAASIKIEDAVRGQLVSDVPVGVLLSGGVDSSLIAAIAAKHYGGKMTAFTVGFTGNVSGDEIDDAKRTATHFGLRHEAVELSGKDLLPVMDKMVYSLEEPGATSSAVPLFMLCAVISRTHKVVLSGQGADEQWGGYLRHLAERHASILGVLARNYLIKAVVRSLPRAEKLKRAVSSMGETSDDNRYALERYLFDSTLRSSLLQDCFPEDISNIQYLKEDLREMEPFQKSLFLDLRTQLPDDLLLYTDKVSMAHSVEVRVPYLDPSLVAFVESLPSRFKVQGFRRKYLFRKIAARYLPRWVLKRKKLGFETPVDCWFRSELNSAVKDLLCGTSSVSKQLFFPGKVEEMISLHTNGKEDLSKQLFMLLSLELWMRRFKVGV